MTEKQTSTGREKKPLTHEKLLAIEVDATAHTGYWADTVIELVQEIRRLQKECALHDSYVVELRQLKEENRKLRERLKEEIVWQDECLKLEEQLQSAQQEIERLRAENEGRKKIIEAYMRIEHDLAEDAERYLRQRDKLIEGLRKLAKTNAENISEIREWKAKQNDPEVTDLDWYNYVARDILNEIGIAID